MRILVEQSGYELKNMGDLAMLQVLVGRLHYIFPSAQIHVFTTAPDVLCQHISDVQPLSTFGRDQRFNPLVHQVYGRLTNQWIAKQWLTLENKVWTHVPAVAQSYVKFKLRKEPAKLKDIDAFLETISTADLVVASGGGFINDEFKNHASFALKTLKLATELGKPTAMLGQGFGPLQNRELIATAKSALSAVNLFGLREKRVGLPFLQSLKVPPEKVVVTGDDAIELAYSARQPELGDGLGINLRVAAYSGVNANLLKVVKSTLHTFAHQENVPLIPIPIAHGFYKGFMETDSASIRQLLMGYDDTSDGGETIDTPLKVIEQVGRCRTVVTGSYHAGVFALSQGIPVVCLAKSQYYVDKFLGLADQFGVGCEVLLLNDKSIQEKLLASIKKSWHLSAQLRPQLLESAQQQIESGHLAYKRLYEIVKT
jgi:polysaccharide pyruvyl transferase WcaK-like protein